MGLAATEGRLAMDGELVLWGILPLGVAVALGVASLYCLCHDFRGVQLLLGMTVLLLAAAAIWILAAMIAGAWPTFLPHVALVLVVPLVAAQVLLLRKRKHAEPLSWPPNLTENENP